MKITILRKLTIGLVSLLLLFAAGCGGGGGGSDASGSNAGGASTATGGTSGSSGTSSANGKYYRRTNGTTALALNGASSYFCSWDGCPSDVTCGVKVNGTDKGSSLEWLIPSGNGKLVTTIFGVLPTSSGITLTYIDDRIGDYVPVSSWASATSGDNGYCSGTGTTGTGTTTGNQSTTGQVAVWTSRSSGSSIAVSIDNTAIGSLTSYFSSTPTCGSSGTLTKTLSVGSHLIKATATGGSWGPSTINITAGGCLMYQLQ